MEVGSAKDIEKFVGKRTRVVDLGGAFAVPGFIDAHIHPAQPYLHQEGGALLFPEVANPETTLLIHDFISKFVIIILLQYVFSKRILQ